MCLSERNRTMISKELRIQYRGLYPRLTVNRNVQEILDAVTPRNNVSTSHFIRLSANDQKCSEGEGVTTFASMRLPLLNGTSPTFNVPVNTPDRIQEYLSCCKSYSSLVIIMQFKAAFVTAAIASLAVASSVPRDDPSGNTCSTGAIQCCNTISNTSNPTIASLAGLLGIVLPSVNVAVGLSRNVDTEANIIAPLKLYAAKTPLTASSPSAVPPFSSKRVEPVSISRQTFFAWI
ncbi:hypothetical protein D9757_013729 [Collybiopsis confluens]|uniref:Hydrophobin n=1 Tax=Collybiopsis confluens TaxID=2823264 RepID=A0A8H5CZQ2_9AGAR|nr:hypothetical protein D9757_013729 [Collybiopsis confluens]